MADAGTERATAKVASVTPRLRAIALEPQHTLALGLSTRERHAPDAVASRSHLGAAHDAARARPQIVPAVRAAARRHARAPQRVCRWTNLRILGRNSSRVSGASLSAEKSFLPPHTKQRTTRPSTSIQLRSNGRACVRVPDPWATLASMRAPIRSGNRGAVPYGADERPRAAAVHLAAYPPNSVSGSASTRPLRPTR